MMITTLTTTTARISSPTTSTSTPMTAFAAAITAAGDAGAGSPSVDRFEHALLDRPSLELLIRELQLVIDYIDQVAQRGLYAHWTCWTPPALLSRSLPTVLPQYEHSSGADSGAGSAEADSAAAAIEAHLKVDVEGGKAACSRFWAIAAAFEADRQVIFFRSGSGNGHNGEVEALKKLLLLLKHEGDDLVEQWQVMVRHVDHELTTHWPAPLFLCGCLPTAAAAAAKKNMIEK